MLADIIYAFRRASLDKKTDVHRGEWYRIQIDMGTDEVEAWRDARRAGMLRDRAAGRACELLIAALAITLWIIF